MKKSRFSLTVTAALVASALGLSSCTPSEPIPETVYGPPLPPEKAEAIQDVYGPPVVDQPIPGEDDQEAVYDPSAAEEAPPEEQPPECVYGPPPVSAPEDELVQDVYGPPVER